MRSLQKVALCLSVMMPWQPFARYNITTSRMHQVPMRTAEADVRLLESRGKLARAQTKLSLNSKGKKEDILWNLLALRIPLRNSSRPAPV